MKRGGERILTTHCGGLPRPALLLDAMRARLSGEPYDAAAYDGLVQAAVREVVRMQIELIAERLVRFARLVGRENVMASADCGFSSQATCKPKVNPNVVRAKFPALAEGARLASRQPWN